MKKCAKCKESKSEKDFTAGKNGKPYSYCRPCALSLTLDWRARNPDYLPRAREISRNNLERKRSAYLARINALKSERPCYDCGGQFSPEAMEFDHLRDKSFELTKGYKHSWDEVREEIDKCQLVCANCHRVRTANRRKNIVLT